ncbi:MAG: DinB family protein, partial [Blastocatellia bacterium]|nr:DinB family protein [Blastocatellia bacterium]
MDNRISEIKSDLRKVSEDAKLIFGNFSAEQLNWQPAENAWSVGQCFEHLIKTNEQFYPEFEKIAAGTRKNTFWE